MLNYALVSAVFEPISSHYKNQTIAQNYENKLLLAVKLLVYSGFRQAAIKTTQSLEVGVLLAPDSEATEQHIIIIGDGAKPYRWRYNEFSLEEITAKINTIHGY